MHLLFACFITSRVTRLIFMLFESETFFGAALVSVARDLEATVVLL
jgi:hypothetical protein